MKKNIFFNKKLNPFVFLIIFFLFFLLVLYLFLFYINNNREYIIIKNENIKYFIIPKDKQGEKVKYLDKKSINQETKNKINNLNLDDISDLKFSIQIHSNTDYEKAVKYMKKFTELKSNLIDKSDIYIFSITTDIGNDYFVSYKNFSSKIEASKFCNKFDIFSECLIINLQTQ